MSVETIERGWRALAAALGILAVGATLPAMCVAATCFKVMDATAYAGKAEMEALGIQPIKLEDPRHWWHGVPDDARSLKEATIKATRPLIGLKVPLLVDLELPLAGQSSDIAANRQRYIDVIQWMREAGFTAPLSYYSS